MRSPISETQLAEMLRISRVNMQSVLRTYKGAGVTKRQVGWLLKPISEVKSEASASPSLDGKSNRPSKLDQIVLLENCFLYV